VQEATDTSSLVAQARLGDQAAWADLYRSAYASLVAFAHHRLGDVDQAKDVVSETMARAVACIDRFTGDDAGFTPWLFGICRNVVGDAQRAKYRFGAPQAEVADRASDEPGPSDLYLAGEEQEAVRAAFARLDEDERELLALRVVAGLSSDDVAAALGKRPSAVRMAQMRALGRLRAFVLEESRVG
jgi:RNA polymerase sigma-70 factor (ECF subfamily)